MKTTPCFYFDDVKVPWDRVFIADNIEMCQKQFHATPAHVYQNYQAQIRLAVKLRFLLGIAHRTAEINGIVGFPQVREMLGQLSAEASMVDAFVVAMETKGAAARPAYFVPDRQMLYAAQTLTQQLYAKVINTLRELAGGGMIMLPSSVKDFGNPEIAGLIGKTQQSPAAGAVDRVKFYKMAWGCGRFRIRLAPRAIRDVLCRRYLRYQRSRVPHLRLEGCNGVCSTACFPAMTLRTSLRRKPIRLPAPSPDQSGVSNGRQQSPR